MIAPRSHLHRRLLTTAAVAAGIMALAFGGAAHAQGVNGSGQITSGTGTISTGPGTTTVNTTSNQTVVTWRLPMVGTTGAPVNFVPVGGNLQFQGNGNYIVLNRFLGFNPLAPGAFSFNRQLTMLGNISSIDLATSAQGGNIWFYNAGGFLVGSGGSFNVGSLVLTANDIDTTGGLLGPGGTIRFRGANGGTAPVQIDAGAVVDVSNPTPGGAYMAVVAPRVVQRGVVNVDGSVAYVAAEQADITINNGLFDINVLVGAEGGTVIDHSGTTTGTAQRDADGRDSRIYMVAMPKNTAVSMLVAGQVGFRDPVTAQVEPNGAIRLSAGYNVAGGEITQTPGSAVAADITVRDIIFNSELIARASNNMVASPLATIPAGFPAAFVPPPQLGLLRFNQNARLIGDNSATMNIGNQQGVVALANLSLISGGSPGGQPGQVGLDLSYNPALAGNRPQMVVGGALLLDASRAVDPFSGGNATGGRATMSVNGGLVNAASITLLAGAAAGYGSATQGGSATGGTTELIVAGAGTLVQAATVSLNSSAVGGGSRDNQNAGITEVAQRGGSATGGLAVVSVSGGAALDVGQAIDINARAVGGTGSSVAGDGRGGQARLSISGGTSRVNAPVTTLDALGEGGGFLLLPPAGQTLAERGGTGFGGTAEVVTDGIANLGDTFLTAAGVGGNANSGANRGGDGIGGQANVLVNGGTTTLARLTVGIEGLAGGGDSNPAVTQSIHGVGQGGSTAIRSDAANLTVNGNISVNGNGNTRAGAGVNTLERRGGTVELRASNGGTLVATGNVDIQVSAGFDPALGSQEQTNRAATGGNITLTAVNNSRLAARGFNLTSNAFTSNAVGSIGDAVGGNITLESRSNSQLQSGIGGAFVSSSGLAGSGPTGGQGRGGTISIIAEGGQVDLNGFNLLEANGTSGLSRSGLTGRRGQGGIIHLQSLATTNGTSEILLGDSFIQSDGQTGQLTEGGVIASSNVAGNGEGGQFLITLQGGAIRGRTLDVIANGRGGASLAALPGGDGQGGAIELNLVGGLLDIDVISLRANGIGQEGGNGQTSGNGTGGRVTVNLNGGAIRSTDMTLGADGFGGQGRAGLDSRPVNGPLFLAGDGGLGRGGSVIFNADAGTVDVGQLRLSANGQGGDGGFFDGLGGPVGDSGDGGAGIGGTAIFNRRGATVNVTRDLAVEANGTGGEGGTILSTPGQPGEAVGGDGGQGTGGNASIVVTANNGTVNRYRGSALGQGGRGASGTVGGDGGSATGGLAEIIIDNVDVGTLFALLRAGAEGGSGGNGNNGAGGDGGFAVGGTARLRAQGPGARVGVTDAAFDMEVRGGNGGFGGRDPAQAEPSGGVAGGNGGRADGGVIDIVAAGGTITLTPNPNNGNVEFFAYASGGFGGGSTGPQPGRGGDSTGGTINLIADGGTIGSAGADVRILVQALNARGGNGISLPDPNTGLTSPVQGASGIGLGGNINIRAVTGQNGPGQINLGSSTLVVDSLVGGRIDIRNLAGGDAVRFAGLAANAQGQRQIIDGPDINDSGIYLEAGQGRIVVNGGMQLTSNSDVTLTARGSNQVQIDGDLVINAGNRIDINHISRTGTAATVQVGGTGTLTAGNVASTAGLAIRSNGDLSINGANSIAMADISSGGSLLALSNGAVGFGSTNAATTIDIRAGGGINLTGPATAGGNVSLRGSALGFGALNAGGAVNLTATAAGISSTGQLRAGTDLVVTAAGSIALANAQAGDDIRLNGAAMTLGDLRTTGVGADAEGDGSDFTITATGNVTIDHAEARGDFRATTPGSFATGLNSIITGGDIVITTGGPANLGNSTAGGLINVAASQIDFNNLVAGATVTLNANQAAAVAGGNNRITGTRIDAGGDASLNGPGGIAVGTITTPANIIATSNAAIQLAQLNAGGYIRATAAGNLNIANATARGADGAGIGIDLSGAAVTFGALVADQSVRVGATGAIIGGDIAAGRAIDLTSTGGGINFNRIASQQATSITAQTNINGQRLNSVGNATLIARNGDITLMDTSVAPQFSSVGGNLVMRGNAIRFGSLRVTGNALIDGVTLVEGNGLVVDGTSDLDADQGNIDVGLDAGGAITASADNIVLRGQGTRALAIARLTTDVGGATVTNARDIVVQQATLAGPSRFEAAGASLSINQASVANGNLTALGRDVTLGSATAAGDLDATAARMLTINGAVVAANIRAASADISIGANGRLGTLGTTRSLNLTNNDRSATAFVGGTGTRNGWHLDAGEITRLFATNVTIDGGRVQAAQNASIGTPRAPDVIVDDFTVNGAQQFGANGNFVIATSGKLRVVGDARFTNLADTQRVRIQADDALEVIMGEGSVVLTGAGTDLGGILELESDDVIVATRAAIADVAAATTIDAINDRLAQNDGVTSDQGAIAARGLFVDARRGFFVQNSGLPGIRGRDYANRRGFTFGAGGLDIATGPATRIVINGQHSGATGPVTGLDTIALIAINGATGATTGFDAGSTVNGCAIVNVARCRIDPDTGFPIQDIVTDEGDGAFFGGGMGQTSLIAPLITLRGIDPLSGEPLIDDPVTGAGNEDMWSPDEEEEDTAQ